MANIVGQKIETKVYIEGHLIPSQRVSVTLYDGATSTLSIDTTPEDSMKKIPPMSMVSVFYFDNNINKWCLFWEGFYTGWQYSRAIGGRSISLMAMDWSGLLQKVSALMLSRPTELVNSQLQIYGMGNSQPFIMSKNNASPQQRLANLAFSYFQPRGVMSFDTLAETVIQQTSGNKTFASMSLALFESLAWLNPLVYYRFDKSKMIKKFTSTKDDNLWDFYEASLLNKVLSGLGQTYFNGPTSSDKIIASWESKMYYSRTTLCAPPFANERITVDKGEPIDDSAFYNFIWHPKSFFGIPPKCNVIFPEFITNISYSRNFMNDATRTILKTTPIGMGDTNFYLSYFYSERNEVVNSEQMLKEMGDPQNIYISQYSPEEFERYIVPTTTKLNGELYHALLNEDTKLTEDGRIEKEKTEKLMGAVTHYMFLEKKYGNRPLTVSGCFNPYFVPGYPCLVFDGTFQFLAKPLSVTHIIDNVSGSATTQYMCNFTIDLDKDDLNSDAKFPPLPGWLPDAYRPNNVDATYRSILGSECGALENFGKEQEGESFKEKVNPKIDDTINLVNNSDDNFGETGIGTSRENVAVLADSLFSLDRNNPRGKYDKSSDKINFARQYILRSVTTAYQYGKFYNIDTTSGYDLKDTFGKGDPFKHIIGIKDDVDARSMYVDEEDLKNGRPNLDKFVKPVGTGGAQAYFDYNKYDKMTEIQRSVSKTGFKG